MIAIEPSPSSVVGTDTRLVIQGHAARTVLDEAISERLRHRRWYRQHPYTLDWPTRLANEVQLRELVRVGRQARRTARAAIAAAEAERRDFESRYQPRTWCREHSCWIGADGICDASRAKADLEDFLRELAPTMAPDEAEACHGA